MSQITASGKGIIFYLRYAIRKMNLDHLPNVFESLASYYSHIIRDNNNWRRAVVSFQNVPFYIKFFICKGFSGICSNKLYIVQYDCFVNDKRLAAANADCCTFI